MATSRTIFSWLSYHIYYHSDLSLLLRDFILPTVTDLHNRRYIKSFFFVRYSLGGPHLRVRLLSRRESRDSINEALLEAAKRFFKHQPSTNSIGKDEILKHNTYIYGSEQDNAEKIRPDNYIEKCAFQPEILRYGGKELLPHSLEYFAISSVIAIRNAIHTQELSRSLALANAFRIMAAQALGLSLSEDDLLIALNYARYHSFQSEGPQKKGAAVFEDRRAQITHNLQEQIKLSCQRKDDLLLSTSHSLALRISTVPVNVKLRVMLSHMHMTANRIGLTNSEEVYISHILWRAAHALRHSDTIFWRDICSTLESKHCQPRQHVDQFLPDAWRLLNRMNDVYSADPKASPSVTDTAIDQDMQDEEDHILLPKHQ